MKLSDFPGIKQQVPLKPYSTFGVGGLADYFCEITDVLSLPDLVQVAIQDKVPYFVLGGGSNILFSDKGFRGLVIKIAAKQCQIVDNTILVDAGVRGRELMDIVHKAGFGGFEVLGSLPGTIGGAVAGNAGCFGKETSDFVERVFVYDPLGQKIKDLGKKDLGFAYRNSIIKQGKLVVLRVVLNLSKVELSGVDFQGKEISRYEKQPPGKSGGSFFKNPSLDKAAGWLIDQCGLKGLKIGGAQISNKHANFFLNVGGASANDLLELSNRVKEDVKKRFGVNLEEEVVIVGESL